jgi:hypothetical protein
MRRSLIMLALIASASVTTAAQAQTGPGTIYYRYGSPTPDTYKVSGNGSNNVKLGLKPGARITARADYPGGRQFMTSSAILGPIPGVDANFGDIVLNSELDNTPTTVTNFRGPQYVDQNGIRARFSNDQRDSFLSFVVYDARIDRWIYYRYNGPVSDFFRPDFVPFFSDDPRLVPVLSSDAAHRFRQFWDWNAAGTLLTFSDKDATGKTVISVLDVTTNSSTVVNNPSVTGLDLTDPWSSPTEFRFFSPATYKDGTRGIASFYPATGQWGWVIKESGSGPKKIWSFSSAAVSPDGTVLAFGMLRVVSNKIIPSLVRIPANGGTYTPLVNFPADRPNTINAGGLGWKW